MATNTEFMGDQPRTHQVQPESVVPQSPEDHMNAHQGDNSKGKSVASPSEETRQRFKAIEGKLRMMESFLPNIVCPPHSHSHSMVFARTPCSKHQYPNNCSTSTTQEVSKSTDNADVFESFSVKTVHTEPGTIAESANGYSGKESH
jgi:hypothetical protein